MRAKRKFGYAPASFCVNRVGSFVLLSVRLLQRKKTFSCFCSRKRRPFLEHEKVPRREFAKMAQVQVSKVKKVTFSRKTVSFCGGEGKTLGGSFKFSWAKCQHENLLLWECKVAFVQKKLSPFHSSHPRKKWRPLFFLSFHFWHTKLLHVSPHIYSLSSEWDFPRRWIERKSSGEREGP